MERAIHRGPHSAPVGQSRRHNRPGFDTAADRLCLCFPQDMPHGIRHRTTRHAPASLKTTSQTPRA